MKKKPVHEEVAEKLIEQLKQGTAPWQRPWSASRSRSWMPMNPVSGKRYQGLNLLQLMLQDREDPRWMSYKQAEALGAQVRQGEQGTRIRCPRTIRQDGTLEDAEWKIQGFRHRTVFNAEQIDGLPKLKRRRQSWLPSRRAERILQASGARIRHIPGNEAYYRPATDTITLPERYQFATADRYYATLLHELGHWTGHASRLARDLSGAFGTEDYAREELRAEIASMILGDGLRIGHDPSQHLAYVDSWIRVLQNDPGEILHAAHAAEQILRFILTLEQQCLPRPSPSRAVPARRPAGQLQKQGS
ncbi:ArdC family protein [Azotobacter salinestris]|uniref:ArdC family protein n=1 Tax=Azotobacter salinestris TaxID=69964 RepID=UPI0032DEE508